MTRVSRRRVERAMVTAETATVLPFLVLVAAVLVWVVSLGLTQLRLADAAADGARMIARGESVPASRRAIEDLVPGARVTIDVDESRVEVRVRLRARPPLLPKVHVDLGGSSTAAVE